MVVPATTPHPSVLPEIKLPLFEVVRHAGVLNGRTIQLVPYIPCITGHVIAITIDLTFQWDGRDETGERLKEDPDKDDEEIEAEQVYQTLRFIPEWTHDLETPLFDLRTFQPSDPVRIFPRWYEHLEDQLCEFVNGILLDSRWRLESLETNVPECLGGITVSKPVELSAMERGYLHQRGRQAELWPQSVVLRVSERD